MDSEFWELRLVEPQSLFEVFAIRYGTRYTQKSELLLNYHLYKEADAPARLDYYFWVARSASHTVVIDCGFSAEVGRRRGLSWSVSPVLALENLGIIATRVPQLILTHLHYDHVGNISEFPNAEILVTRRELEFWQTPLGSRTQLGAYTEASEIMQIEEAAQQGRVTLVGSRSSPVPGIEIIEVGGHTPGQAVVVVSTRSGRVVIASDALHLYEELDRDRPYSVVSDLVDMYRTYDLLREITSAPGTVLVAGHDPEVMNRFAACTGELEGIAVRID